VAIHFVGQGDDLQAAMGLARSWDYAVSHQPAADAAPPEIRRRIVVITLASQAAMLRNTWPAATPLIVLVDTPGSDLPAGIYPLSLPLRPAKLRALLEQLQKTLPKSMP
jgi:hypothetical protein